MIGTIRRNNVLEPMSPYGCYQRLEVRQVMTVQHSSGKTSWPMRMSTSCRYDQRAHDQRCAGCAKPYDNDYVESLT